MKVNAKVRSEISQSTRVRQLAAMFDVPMPEVQELSWSGEVPFEDRPWNVGLIVGPSGCGKTTIAKHLFGDPIAFSWGAKSVIDDFAKSISMNDVSAACQAVGFNTIPAWMRPYNVLSNGEQFRVNVARALLETEGTIVIDEFTSVVDRQVAQIGSHAIQKNIRKRGRQFVAVSCHYDIIDWLQPDWVFEPATMKFQWRSLQRRPQLECVVGRVSRSAWELFAPYHYLTADLSTAAQCFGLWCGGRLAAFAGALYRPNSVAKDVIGISRLVTLPDFQGMGLAMVLVDRIGAAYKGIGLRLHTYPAHPALIRSFDRSPDWRLEKKPGTTTIHKRGREQTIDYTPRFCAVFSYRGEPMGEIDARRLLGTATYKR